MYLSEVTETKFVLGVDLDGVVADFYPGLRPIAAEWLGVGLEALLQYAFIQPLAINEFSTFGHMLAVDAFANGTCGEATD